MSDDVDDDDRNEIMTPEDALRRMEWTTTGVLAAIACVIVLFSLIVHLPGL